MKSGFIKNESFNIPLGKDVTDVELIRGNWPTWDLTTTVQVGSNLPINAWGYPEQKNMIINSS